MRQTFPTTHGGIFVCSIDNGPSNALRITTPNDRPAL